MRTNFAASVIAMTMLTVAPTAAQPTGEPDFVAAQSLYDEGNRLYRTGKYEEACPKFEASVRINAEDLDARGMLALCSERIGKLATAWTQFRDLKARATRQNRVAAIKIAEEHIAALTPRLAQIAVAVASPVTGLAVTRDGFALPPESYQVPLAVDRGTHTLVATAPGYTTWSTTFTIMDGERKSIDVPPLAPVEVTPVAVTPVVRAPEPVPVATVPSVEPTPRVPPIDADASPRPMRRWLAIGSAAVGLTALGVSAWAGLDARSKRDRARDLGCSDDLGACPPAALETANSAHARGTLATGFAILGLVGVVTGTVLYVTAPEPARRAQQARWRLAPTIDSTSASITLGQRF